MQTAIRQINFDAAIAALGGAKDGAGKVPLQVVKATWNAGLPKSPGEPRSPVWRVVLKNQTDKPICNIRYATLYFNSEERQISAGGYFSGPNSGWLSGLVIKPGEQRTVTLSHERPRAGATRGEFEIVFWEHWDPKQKLFCESH